MTDRELMLGRIRAALTPAPAPVVVPRAYRTAGEHPPGSQPVLDLFVDRLADYRATVHRCQPAAIAATVAAALSQTLDLATASSGAGPAARLLVPAGLPAGWLADWSGVLVTDPDPITGPLSIQLLDGVAGVVTGCAVAIAETGTIVLDGSADQGRRAISLVPDLHLVVVRAEQVVATVPEGIALIDPGANPAGMADPARAAGPRPVTLISGPSATSDIELERVEGVHGPRTLIVVLVG